MTQANNVAIESSQINSSGVLQPAGGGTGTTTSTGSGNNVLSTSPTLVTPALGTPSSATLTNATGLPLTTGVTGTLPIANGGTGSTTAAIIAGTGISVSGTFPNQTVTNSGVTSTTAGTGISVSGSTGSVTITNSGVTSVSAGSGISVSSSTGGVTITNTSSVNSAQLAVAWVSFNNSGTIGASYNVSSISVRGTGLWTVNFSSSLTDANYAMATSASPGNTMFNSGGCFCSFQYGPSQNYSAPSASAAYIYTTSGTYNGSDAKVFNPYITSCIFHR